MIRIALVEDDPAYAEQLTSYLREYEKGVKRGSAYRHFRMGKILSQSIGRTTISFLWT